MARRLDGTRVPGCICYKLIDDEMVMPDGILPECEYHRAAAEEPENHSIPWNCPTYWNGCNCESERDVQL